MSSGSAAPGATSKFFPAFENAYATSHEQIGYFPLFANLPTGRQVF